MIFEKQLEKSRISNAYLIEGYGDNAAQAWDMAVKLLDADEARQLRMEMGNEPHLIHMKENLKKEDVLKIQSEFSKTQFSSGYRVYIIEGIERASISALNSLLKFLEEPGDGVVAILTTQAPSRVLDTIRSRCVVLNSVAHDISAFMTQASDLGFDQEYGRLAFSFHQDLNSLENCITDMVGVFDLFQEASKYIRDKRYVEVGIFIQVEAITKLKINMNQFRNLIQMMIADFIELRLIGVRILDLLGPGVNVNLMIDLLAVELRGVSV